MGLRVGRLAGDLEPVDELHTLDDFWQMVVAVETAPTLLRALDQFEHHGERGLVREASLLSDGPVPHGREGAFDGVCRSQVLAVLGGKIVEGEQRFAILLQASGGAFSYLTA